jgi:hypothetical protein
MPHQQQRKIELLRQSHELKMAIHIRLGDAQVFFRTRPEGKFKVDSRHRARLVIVQRAKKCGILIQIPKVLRRIDHVVGRKNTESTHHFIMGDEALDRIAQESDVLGRTRQKLVQAEDHVSLHDADSFQFVSWDFSDTVQASLPFFQGDVFDPNVVNLFSPIVPDKETMERHSRRFRDVQENDFGTLLHGGFGP